MGIIFPSNDSYSEHNIEILLFKYQKLCLTIIRKKASFFTTTISNYYMKQFVLHLEKR